MSKDPFIIKLEDQILTVTINRPEHNNTLTIDLMYEFADLFKKANTDDEIRCIIVTGEGEYFCAGADISKGVESFNPERFAQFKGKDYNKDAINDISPGSQICFSINNCLKPVIAAINGATAGVGGTMILSMDYRIMADSAKIAYRFTQRGLVPEAGSTWLLPRVVGLTKACDWMISGRDIEAAEAKESGLVNNIYAKEDLLPAAYELAHKLTSTTSAVAVACTRQLLRMAGNFDLAEMTAAETVCFIELLLGPDAREGVLSFLEKRPPHFSGKVSKDLPDIFKTQ